jgi:PAS domain S-box-containing protein
MDLTNDGKLLRNTIDSSMDMIQVFKVVRDERGEIIDFKWILNNKTSEKFYGDVIGKSLLTLNPAVVKEGIFDVLKKVVETGEPNQSIRHYVYEQFDGWFLQSAVKQDDGVATTTKDITDIKKAEDDLRELEELRRIALESGAMGTWTWNTRERTVRADQVVQQLWGVSTTEQPHPVSLYSNLMYPEGVSLLEDGAIKNNAPDEEMRAQLKVARGPASGRWMELRGRAEHDMPWIINGVSFDITERKQAEEALRESEKRFDSIANLVPDLLWASEPDGSTDWHNQRWLEYTGQRFEQAIGWGWVDTIHPDDRDGSARRYAEAVKAGKPLRQEHRIRRNDGEYRWFVVNATPVKDENFQVIKMYGTATDIHDSKQAEEALRDSEQRLQQALSIPTVGVIFFDLQGVIHHANEAFCRLSGYTKDDFHVGKVRWDEVTPPEFMQATLTSREELRTSGENTPYQKQCIRPDGSRWWGLSAGKRLSKNECVEFVVDITEQKQNEQRKNDFISMVSHELKTPLTSTIGYIQVSQKKAAMKGDQVTGSMLERASKQLKKMTNLINGFLNVGRLEAGQIHIDRKHFDMAVLVKEVEESLVPEATTHQIVFAPTEETWVNIDNDKIEQVINNFISNAIKYSPLHTTIQITCLRLGTNVRVAVKDEGMGVRLEDQAKLFDRFYRVEGQETLSIAGFGIGLYLCKENIDRHGGNIGVQSTMGKGSTFWCELPIHERIVRY